jgi:hypothetical protein
MRTPLKMRDLRMLTLKPLCTFDTVELSQPGQILCCSRALMLQEMFRRFEIFGDLIEVSAASQSAVRTQKIIFKQILNICDGRASRTSSSAASWSGWISVGCPW